MMNIMGNGGWGVALGGFHHPLQSSTVRDRAVPIPCFNKAGQGTSHGIPIEIHHNG